MRLMLRTALVRGGLIFGMRETFQTHIDSGAPIPLLNEFCPPLPESILYIANWRNIAPKLPAVIEYVGLRAPERSRRSIRSKN